MSESPISQKKEMNINEFKDYLSGLSLTDILIKTQIIKEEDVENGKIRCLFHDEKTASMALNDTESGSYFYCFGCGAKGDAIALVEKLYDFSFIQALSFLADAYGITLLSGSFNPFLQNGISYSDLENEWQGYLKNLKEKVEKDPSIKDAIKKFFPLEVGWDKKINYFVFRYTSKAGKTLGFTKRRSFELSSESDNSKFPKWKHSTIKNSKIGECHNIFNLGNAIKTINERKQVYLVEGPKDTIPFTLTNHKNVVAISGVNNTTKIFDVLPEVEEIILALDGDSAGRNGEQKIIEFLIDRMPLENIKWINFGTKDPYDYYYENNKSLPEPESVMSLFTDEGLKHIYKLASPFNKEDVIAFFSQKNNKSYTESKSFFEMGYDPDEVKKKKEAEMDRLIKSKDENALKKLALKYDIE